ncbi:MULTISPECIES: J domain-containing protein [Peptoniphilaceae]|uniref:J domain-containing protein n=1 Tax=Peptoniphilaceae TaxID=1570339 RepID=UPI000318C777|nr:J domain-containing protein [Peptoniphilus senegalensis]
MGQIIEFPDDKKSRERIKELKRTLENLVFERDNLKYVICENIKTAYMLTFGSLEYRLYKSYCKYLRLKRKRDMIQAKKNRQEKIKMDLIEMKLDEEFCDYKKKLEEKTQEINDAIKRSKAEVLSDEDAKLLKKCYKSIVKKLHPDINPNVTDAEKELFYNATEAYKNGDLASLQIIYDIVCSSDDIEDKALSGKSLGDEVKRLEDLVDQIQRDIDLIKYMPPYTWRIYVKDKKKKSEKLSQLERDLKSFKDAIRMQEEAIEVLMRDET